MLMLSQLVPRVLGKQVIDGFKIVELSLSYVKQPAADFTRR